MAVALAWNVQSGPKLPRLERAPPLTVGRLLMPSIAWLSTKIALIWSQ
jgi:hypothetical protein